MEQRSQEQKHYIWNGQVAISARHLIISAFQRGLNLWVSWYPIKVAVVVL